MELRLKRLHLENFKCHKKLTIDFGGRSTSIYGDNATGKTSIYDGLTWLLFGKDSLGNGEKSLEIKPLRPDGSVEDHEAVTEVEAVFLADGEEVRLKRSFRTFLEVAQPESEFILRLDSNGQINLIGADGGAWKLEAVRSIAAYFDEQLGDLVKAGRVVVLR